MFEQYRGKMKDLLLPLKDFKPFPKYEDRAAWEELGGNVREFMIRRGEEYLHYGWPTTLASVYMDFYRNGNRRRYENILFDQRRCPLLFLVLAECCEGKGRFIDDIINGVWVTLDEATWIIPASNKERFPEFGDTNHALPYTQEPERFWLELFTAECAAHMSMIYYLLGDRLAQESPQIPHRMLGEIERRAFRPFLNNDHFWWMGLQGQTVNNWNPWICFNLLTMATLACPDEEMRAQIAEKCLLCMENFVKIYAPDGGCDEGPSYWGHAAATLFSALNVLEAATDGKVDYRGDELIRNMCAYVYKVHINGDYYTDYADSPAQVRLSMPMIYRMGKYTGDENLVQMGIAGYKDRSAEGTAWELSRSNVCIYKVLQDIFVASELENAEGTYPWPQNVWFPGIQVMAARREEGSCKGLYLSAKGGTNGESHNHNDVGTFVVYCDGKPAIIDIGTGEYTKQTFSDGRYEIPQINSYYHNLPIIGGEGQLPGVQYTAQDVTYTCDEKRVDFGVELRGVYPEAAGVESWKRSFLYDRAAGTVTVADDFALTEEKDVQLVLITKPEPVFAPGEMTLVLDEESTVTASFDPAWMPATEFFPTGHDANLTKSWGTDGVYRTVFTLPGKVKNSSHAFIIRKK